MELRILIYSEFTNEPLLCFGGGKFFIPIMKGDKRLTIVIKLGTDISHVANSNADQFDCVKAVVLL